MSESEQTREGAEGEVVPPPPKQNIVLQVQSLRHTLTGRVLPPVEPTRERWVIMGDDGVLFGDPAVEFPNREEAEAHLSLAIDLGLAWAGKWAPVNIALPGR